MTIDDRGDLQLTQEEFDGITGWGNPVPYFMEPYRWTRTGTLATSSGPLAIEVAFSFDEDEEPEFTFETHCCCTLVEDEE